MVIKQLSVFIENREGRLEKVTQTIKDHNINIVSLSLADTTEYGMLRLIVSDPERAKKVLKEEGFSAMLTDVIAVKLPHQIGMLHDLLKILADVDISIEYMYTLATGENASIILKVSDLDKSITALKENNLELFQSDEAYQINC